MKASVLKLLGLPGWSCTRQIESWMGQPIRVVDHFEQLQALADGMRGSEAWCPDEEWALVSWSMGTKTAIELSKGWGDRPPKFWLALSPFLHFVGPDSANQKAQVDQLKAGLLAKPESALKLFTRGHGVREPWFDLELEEENVKMMAHSLDLLCEPMSFDNRVIDVPVYVACGTRDSLVNTWMVEEFVGEAKPKAVTFLEGISHAIFYEEPESLAETLKEWQLV